MPPSSSLINESHPSRRTLYRCLKRVLLDGLAGRWRGPRDGLESAVRRYLRPRSRRDLALMLRDRSMTLAAATTLLTVGAAAAAPPVELSDIAAGDGGFIMTGVNLGDYAGRSVASAGDVNGDGLDDLIVGAPGVDEDGDEEVGAAYVVFGRTDTAPVDLQAIASGMGGFIIYGTYQYNAAGFSVSDAADVNGDGLDDVIVGAPGVLDGAGFSYVVFGKTDTDPVQLGSFMEGGFAIRGIDFGDFSGRTVSGAGDVNGDGLDDLIVGAYNTYEPGVYSGENYVIFGKADTNLVHLTDIVAGDGGFVIRRSVGNDYSGQVVSGAGDVNGDGLGDVIVGAPGQTTLGESYVVFGTPDTDPIDLWDIVGGNGGFVIRGANPGDAAGVGVSDAGDVNGDGLGDLIVGAPGADPGGNSGAGESYVVFGTIDTAPIDLADVADGSGGFVMRGIDPTDGCGRAVSGAGDVNGDGLADLIVSAPFADPGGNANAGESYVVFGKADTTPVELADVSAGDGGFVINGIAASDQSGSSVSDAGDVNGDGRSDVVIGAWVANPGGIDNAGESYVVFGPSPPPGCDADLDGDGTVGPSDLATLLAAWGPCDDCPADLDDDGVVGGADLAVLLATWGPCP